jgi:hypothetical protein
MGGVRGVQAVRGPGVPAWARVPARRDGVASFQALEDPGFWNLPGFAKKLAAITLVGMIAGCAAGPSVRRSSVHGRDASARFKFEA